MYPSYRQKDYIKPQLKETDAYPADPEDGYGWEKLFNERMCRHFYEDFGLETRIARYHNVYGEYGSWKDGREKAPAALARKFVESIHKKKNQIDIGEKIISQSIIGSTFECFIENENNKYSKKMILPNIKGSAFITGEQILYKDERDPFPQGYRLNDTWPL